MLKSECGRREHLNQNVWFGHTINCYDTLKIKTHYIFSMAMHTWGWSTAKSHSEKDTKKKSSLLKFKAKE